MLGHRVLCGATFMVLLLSAFAVTGRASCVSTSACQGKATAAQGTSMSPDTEQLSLFLSPSSRRTAEAGATDDPASTDSVAKPVGEEVVSALTKLDDTEKPVSEEEAALQNELHRAVQAHKRHEAAGQLGESDGSDDDDEAGEEDDDEEEEESQSGSADDDSQLVEHLQQELTSAIEGFRKVNTTLAKSVADMASSKPALEPVVKGSGSHDALLRPGSTAGQPQLLPIASAHNESCTEACHSKDLQCYEPGFHAINTCGSLKEVFGCAGGCLASVGDDKPSVMRVPGHPHPLCFTKQHESSSHGDHHGPDDWDDHFSCAARIAGAQRLCGCIPRNLYLEEREALRQTILEEQQLQLDEMKRLERLREEIQNLVTKFDGTKNALQHAEEMLVARESQLQQLKEDEALQDAVDALTGSGATVDYATGAIRLRNGDTFTPEEVNEVVRKNTERGHTTKKKGIRDPAILVYDFVLLSNVGILLVGAAFGGIVSSYMKLPAGLGYLVGGAVVGPSGLGLISMWEQVGAIAQFGAVFPLFSMGMEFTLTNHLEYIRRAAGIASASVILYMLLLVPCAVWLFPLIPSVTQAILIAIPTALSSPGVTLANLKDTGVTHSRAGKLVMGMLAVQDLLMCLLLSVPHAIAFGVDITTLAQTTLSIIGLGTLAFGLSRMLLRPTFVEFFEAKEHKDVVVLGLVALCLCMALITGTMGLSLEMGAFVAGITVTYVPNIEEAAKSVEPLSRVFGGLFFASIGMLMSPMYLWNHFGIIFQCLFLVVTIKVVVLASAMYAFGGGKKCVTAAVASAQVTEYSLMFTGKAHALSLLERYPYLMWLSCVVLSLVVSPLLTRLYGVWDKSGLEGGEDSDEEGELPITQWLSRPTTPGGSSSTTATTSNAPRLRGPRAVMSV